MNPGKLSKYPLATTLVLAAMSFGATPEFKVPPGGAPPLGSGSVTVNGYVRVVDATNYEVYINGQQSGVKLLGVDAPAGNTTCGQEAANVIKSIFRVIGPISFDEDINYGFDDRKLRNYYISKGGVSLAAALISAGSARPNGIGKETARLATLLDLPRTSKLGCLWNGSANKLVANAQTAKPSTSNAGANPSSSAANSEMIPATFSLRPDATAAAVSAAPAAEAAAQSSIVLPAGFVQDTVVSGLYLPTAFSFLPDGRILVAQQNGVVRIVKNGTLLSTPFIDLSDRVNSFWDRGMIGMTVDNNFANNGYVYLMYVYENDPNDYTGTKTARLVRVTAAGDTASPATETVILGKVVGRTCHDFPAGADCMSADSQSHSVGNIRMTSDGTLWATMGDGGSFTVVDDDTLRTQDIDSLNGKVFHITATGAGLPSNPYWNGDANANRSKVYATGMRNSFRFNFRPGTNTPYLGEVGWGSYDEVNVGTPGANFGWPCYEGTYVQSGFEDKPVCQALYARGPGAITFGLVEWYHGGTSAASVGGAFYTGTSYPAEYQGSYFYGDYAASFIRNLRVDANNKLIAGPFEFATSAEGPSQIESGPDTNIWYLSLNTGELRRLRYNASADTTPPTIVSTTPASNATTFGVTSDLKVVFSEGMNASSISGSTLTLVKQSTGSAIPVTVTYNVAERSAVVHPTTALDNGTQYGLTVQGGAGGVTDAAGNPLMTNSSLIFSTVALPPSGTTFLSDLGATSSINGYGPAERDQSNGDAGAGDGKVITLGGTTYNKGIGVHSVSDLRYSLGGSCTALTATVGIDDEVPAGLGTAVFQILLDGVKVYDSGTLMGSGPRGTVNVNLTGAGEMALLVNDGGDGNSWDHGDWANARITCSGGTTGAPTVGSTNPATNATNVAVSIYPSATFSKAMNASTLTATTFTLQKQGTSTNLAGAVSYDPPTRTATFRPTTTLQSGTVYVATIKGGSSGVKDSNNVAQAGDYTWTFTTSTQSTFTTYLSDLTWTAMTNGWGPVEKDKSNGEDQAGDGSAIKLRGTSFPKGLGAHSNSTVTYNFNGACSVLSATVGVDDEVGPNGTVIFQVFGDGTQLYGSGLLTGGGTTRSFNVDISGKNQVSLVLNDGGDNVGSDHGDWADAKVICAVANTEPTPTITSPVSTLTYKVGDTITFAGSATDTEDGAIPAANLAWSIIIHHCPGGVCHLHPFLSQAGAGGSFVIPDHGDDSYFELQLTATDSGGLTNTKSVSIQPKTVTITLATSPSGLQVIYGGDRGVSPYTRTTIVGSAHSILAQSPQGNLVFSSWSDGGAAQHNVTIGSANATYTANFVQGSTGQTTRYLSDVAWTSATNGSGPVERDQSNGGAGAKDGRTMSLKGVTFSKGLGAAANSDIRFNLGGACSRFSAVVGVDDEVSPNGSVVFSVLADGVQVFNSGRMTGNLDGQTLDVNVAGKNVLALQISDSGDGTASDHGDWANAIVTCGADTAAPTVTGQSPANNATAVATSAVVTATFSEPMAAASLTSGAFSLLRNSTSTVVSGAVTYDPQTQTATLTPSASLAAGNYTATLVGGGGAADLAGNTLGASVSWTFSVGGDTTPPSVSATTPINGATGVAGGTAVNATFSEPLMASSVTATNFTLSRSGIAVGGTVGYNSANNSAAFTPAAALQAGATYVATLKGGASGIKDVSGNALLSDYTWTFTVASGTTQAVWYASNLPFQSATSGWGPVERDRSNGEQGASDGNPLTVGGVTYAKGIGAHSASDIRIAIGGACSTFKASVGVDGEVGGNGSVVFKVLGDGTTLYTSALSLGGAPAQQINISVAGVNQLALQISDSGDGNGSDHGDWADAQFLCADTAAPQVTATNPLNNATGVAGNVTPTATFSEAMQAASFTSSSVQLSTGGTVVPTSVSYDIQAVRLTITPSAALTMGSLYTVTLKSGTTGVKDLSGNPIAADVSWSFTLSGTTQASRYLSDLPWVSSTNGWGPAERDKSNGEQGAADGNTLRIAGTSYTKGIGAHADSNIKVNVGGSCSRFTSTVGVDGEVAPSGSVIFTVLADGQTLYTSPLMTQSSQPANIDVNISGKNVLELRIGNGGDDYGSDHGDWANAQVYCTPDITAPTVSSTTPASGATGVAANAAVQAVLSEAMAASSIGAGTFTLTRQGTSTAVAAAVTYNKQTLTATLQPSANLTSGAIYNAAVKGGTGGVMDLSGNVLATSKTWSFTVR